MKRTPLTPFPSQSLTVFSTAFHPCFLRKQSAALPPKVGTILISEGKGQAAGRSHPQLPVPYAAARGKARCAPH